MLGDSENLYMYNKVRHRKYVYIFFMKNCVSFEKCLWEWASFLFPNIFFSVFKYFNRAQGIFGKKEPSF